MKVMTTAKKKAIKTATPTSIEPPREDGHPLSRGRCSGTFAEWICGGSFQRHPGLPRQSASCAEDGLPTQIV